ncbi:CGNR zinc finger domain-containing protein [Streptomyces sp. NPDC001604]
MTLGRCAAAGCGNYFVDRSHNRTRRFCSDACASRTTVEAHRARAAKKP